jgi:hypothetical protein
MTVTLDVNKLHRKDALKEGAHSTLSGDVPSRPLPPSGRNFDDLVAGEGCLLWRDQEIEWVLEPIPISKNPPPSWRGSSGRSRPLFRCGECGALVIKLHLHEGFFHCAACSGYVRPSRRSPRDPLAGDFARLAKLRSLLGVQGLFDDPNVSRPPPSKPRSVWLWKRRVRALRELELRLGQRLDGMWSARLFGAGRSTA